MDFDYAFILAQEGGFSEVGEQAFVPTDVDGEPLGKSGVTFAGGFDIGQIDLVEARRLCGESRALYNRIAPYVGATKKAAQALLEAEPLWISFEDMEFLCCRKYSEIYESLGNHYGRDKFSRLLKAVRTILLSVAVQYGANLRMRTPRFWHYAVLQDWQNLLDELRNFGDAYNSRRNREADYLERAFAVNKGTPSIL